jgi:RimJ/RimL family protein N-acetyltransferase
MQNRWTGEVPSLSGNLITLREVATSDVNPLFTLLSNPAVRRHMAPPPPTLSKFAGFVEWSHRQRVQGRGVCFAIVPQGMTAAIGILQLRLDLATGFAEWGFVLSTHFWSTGVFVDAADAAAEFAFADMQVEGLEARIATRNERARAAIQKLGARFEKTIAVPSPNNIPRDPEQLWILREDDWRNHAPVLCAPELTAQRLRSAIAAAESELRWAGEPDAVEPFPLFMFDRRRRENDAVE